jgi:hypothetical protein
MDDHYHLGLPPIGLAFETLIELKRTTDQLWHFTVTMPYYNHPRAQTPEIYFQNRKLSESD